MEAKIRVGGSPAGTTHKHAVQGAGDSGRGVIVVDTEIDSTAHFLIVNMEIQQAGQSKPLDNVEYQSTELARRSNRIQY